MRKKQIYNETKQPTVPVFCNVVCYMPILLATVAFGATGLAVYLTYGNLVQSNVLLTFPDSLNLQIAELLLAIGVTASFPLQIHPARAALATLEQGIAKAIVGVDASEWYGTRFPDIQMWINTIILLIVTFVVGVTVNDLGVTIGVLGSITITALAFYIPGFMFFKLFEEEATTKVVAGDAENGKVESRKDVAGPSAVSVGSEVLFSSVSWLQFHRWLALCGGVVGVVLTPLTLYAIYV